MAPKPSPHLVIRQVSDGLAFFEARFLPVFFGAVFFSDLFLGLDLADGGFCFLAGLIEKPGT